MQADFWKDQAVSGMSAGPLAGSEEREGGEGGKGATWDPEAERRQRQKGCAAEERRPSQKTE